MPTPNYEDILGDTLKKFAELVKCRNSDDVEYCFHYETAMSSLDKAFQQALTKATERAVRERDKKWKDALNKIGKKSINSSYIMIDAESMYKLIQD